MDKGNRETLSFNFDGEIGNVRRTLGERILLRQCLVIAVSVRPCSVVGVIIVGRYEEKLQWYWLCVCLYQPKGDLIAETTTHPTIDFILFMLALLLNHEQCMVK